MIAAHDPDRAIVFEQAFCLSQPSFAKTIVVFQTIELIPVICDTLDGGFVWSFELFIYLQKIRRVGEDGIDALRGQLCHGRGAVTEDKLIDKLVGSLR